MKHIPIRLGPIALLLTVITICLAVMAILTISTAGADLAQATKFAESTQIRCTLERAGQDFLREADDMLAGGGSLTDLPGTEASREGPAGSVEKTMRNKGYQLTVRLEPEGKDDYRIGEWSLEKTWQQDQDLNVWQP